MLVNAQVRVYYPPSPWHEKRYSVETSCFLEPKFHAAWAQPQYLGSQSARSVDGTQSEQTSSPLPIAWGAGAIWWSM